MDSTLIVKTGTTLPSISARRGDFEDWIRVSMGIEPTGLTVTSVFEDAQLPDPEDFAGIVITGSSAMVSHREPWSERTAAWLRNAVKCETPLLGICYGHQLFASMFGGNVEFVFEDHRKHVGFREITKIAKYTNIVPSSINDIAIGRNKRIAHSTSSKS